VIVEEGGRGVEEEGSRGGERGEREKGIWKKGGANEGGVGIGMGGGGGVEVGGGKGGVG